MGGDEKVLTNAHMVPEPVAGRGAEAVAVSPALFVSPNMWKKLLKVALYPMRNTITFVAKRSGIANAGLKK